MAAVAVLLGYGLSFAALLPAALVVAEHGFARHVGGWLCTAVPASLLASAVMLHLTLRLRGRWFAAPHRKG